MEAKYEVRIEYGTVRYYPRCDTAKTIVRIARTSTLRSQDMHLAKELGISWVECKSSLGENFADSKIGYRNISFFIFLDTRYEEQGTNK